MAESKISPFIPKCDAVYLEGMSIRAYAEAMATTRTHVVMLPGSSYSYSDIPNPSFKYGTALIMKRNANYIVVVLFRSDGKPAMSSYINTEWTAWTDLMYNTYS